MSLLEKLFANKAFYNKLTSEALSKNITELQDKIGFGESPTFNAESFDSLDSAKIVDYQGFDKTKGPGDVALVEKLNSNSDQANFIKNAIKTALKRDDNYIKAQKDFNSAGTSFPELLKKVPSEFSAPGLIAAMKEVTTEAKNKITEQHNLEIQRLTEQFDLTLHPDFSTNLMHTLGIAGAPTDESATRALTLVKNNLLNDLKESHKKQQDEFNKQTDESLEKLNQSYQEKINEMNLLYALAKEDKRNLDLFIKTSREKGEPQPAAGIAPEVSISEQVIQFKNISIKDIKKFQNVTGTEIVQEPVGVFTVQFSAFNPFYYGDPRQKPLADMMLIAKLIKEAKYPKITMTITGFSAKDQTLRAQQAFEACIRNGFKLDQITIKIGDQVKKPEDLFRESQETYSQLINLSDTMNEKKIETPIANAAHIKTAKQAISDLREVKPVDNEEPHNNPGPGRSI